jgi:hypothetical protein
MQLNWEPMSQRDLRPKPIVNHESTGFDESRRAAPGTIDTTS